MADYIFARKSRNILSTTIQVFLNLLLGISAVLVTTLSGSPSLGILLVLASKWRVFAVRWRYLGVNIKANLVDIIVGISIVLLSYYSGTTILLVHPILAAVYLAWLFWLKPLSSEWATLTQSLVAIFLGVSATVIASATFNPIIITAVAFLIGFAAARHVLIQSNDKDFSLVAIICGLVFAEIAWLCQSWTIVYTFGSTGIRIPQLAIILTLLSFTYNYVRRAAINLEEKFSFKDAFGPIAFTTVLIIVMVLWFSQPIFNI